MNAAQKRIHLAALRLFSERGNTEVNVSELAQMAGVARGTIYNNLESTDHLFEQVAAQLAEEMDDRVAATYKGVDDPAQRLAIGVRLYAKRAHAEPHWGRFLVHFGMTSDAMRKLWMGPPMHDIELGIQAGRFRVKPEQAPAALGLLAGTTVSAIVLVLEGFRTWRDAGSDAAELVLRGLGLNDEDARTLAVTELPILVEID
jgi:AcrR family transcriptional regulator